MQTGPLAGLRIVDASQQPDAVVASSFLADLGADVTLLEPPTGHPARALGPFKSSTSLLWTVTARHKRILCVADSQELDDLLREADALILDTGSGAVGIAFDNVESVAARHPHLVIVTTSAFGTTGPLAGRSGTGRAAEAFGGQTFAAGDPERAPLHSGLPIGAAATALFGALGVVAGVLERDQQGDGRGQTVDVAGYEAVLRLMEFLPIFYQQTGFRNERAGNGSSYQVPVATWLTADGKWVTFTGNTNDVVHRLYRAMGQPELIDDARFATNDGRVANREVVERTLSDWAGSLPRPDLERLCEEHRVPLGSVLSTADIFADEHVRARQSIVDVDDAQLGRIRIPRAVPRFSGDGREAAVAPSRLPWGAASHSGHGPLAGLRVIDMGQILAGPYAATLLADLGADVVKVERPGSGDDFRRQAPLHSGVSLWWKASARNKRSIALDLKDADDRAIFLELVAAADVITANFVPGTLERLGLGYDDLCSVNPAIVLVSVSGYGQDGPYRTRRAFGRNAEAYAGLAYVTGYAEGPPMPTGCPVADCLSAIIGAFGALCALFRRQRTADGHGELVDVALYESVLRMLELPALVYDQLGAVVEKSEHCTGAGEVVCVAQSSDGHWMSASGWGEHDIASMRTYVEHRNRNDLLGRRGVPDDWSVAPVNSIDELLADEHCRARTSIITVADDELGEVALAGVVPRFGRTPGQVAHASPMLDEHRKEVITEWRTG